MARSIADVINSLIINLKSQIPLIDTKPGTVVRDLLNVIAQEVVLSEVRIDDIRRRQSILTATGSEIDDLVYNWGLVRLGATYASGIVQFAISDTRSMPNPIPPPEQETVTIPAGTVVGITGLSAITYATTEDLEIDPGSFPQYWTSDIIDGIPGWVFSVPVICQVIGTVGNVGNNVINSILTPISANIDFVMNQSPILGGLGVETDEQLLTRARFVFSGNAAGTSDSFALAVLGTGKTRDVLVQGAGDPLMKRDAGNGGMVDIYVREREIKLIELDFVVPIGIGEREYDIFESEETGIRYKPVIDILTVQDISGAGQVYERGIDWDFRADTVSDFRGSIRSEDKFIWKRDNDQELSLRVTVLYDGIINELQAEVEKVRTVTSDVLVREAQLVEINVAVDIRVEPGSDTTEVISAVDTVVSSFINRKRLGETIMQVSDLVNEIHNVSGVDDVVLSDVSSIWELNRNGVISPPDAEGNLLFNLNEFAVPGSIVIGIVE